MSSNVSEMKKNIEEWKEVREQVVSLGKGEVTVGKPSCSLEVMYSIRAAREQDPECDFSIKPGTRSPSVLRDKDGNPLPTSEVEPMPTTPEEWDEWYALNEKINSKSPLALLVEKEKNVLVEQELATKLAELESKISVESAKIGITFDDKTGETQIDLNVELAADSAANIEDLAAELGMKTKAPAARAIEPEIESTQTPAARVVESEVKSNQVPVQGKDVDDEGIVMSRTSAIPTVELTNKTDDIDIEDERMPGVAMATPVARNVQTLPREEKEDDDLGEIPLTGAVEKLTSNTSSNDGGNPSTGLDEKDNGQPKSIKDLASEIMAHPALVKEINAIKERLMDRDVKAKKVLDARRKLEIVKDAMDMDAAIYAVQKYRMQIEIATMKIALMRAVEQGRPHEADHLKRGIADVAARISKLESDFAISNEGHLVELNGAKTNLENATKTVEMERRNDGLQNMQLLYSEEGLLKGMGVEVDVSGRTVNELELFDERGVIVEDVEDVLARTMSYNIEGTVVVRHTEIEADKDTTDVYNIGNLETLEIETQGGNVEVNEAERYNGDMSDNVIATGPHRSPEDPSWDVRRDLGRITRGGSVAMYALAGVGAATISTAADLASLTPEMLVALRDAGLRFEQLGKLDSARKGAHPETRGMSLKEWIQGVGPEMQQFLAEIFMDKFEERQREMNDPENDFGEIKPPPEASGNNSNNY